ncbi:glycerol kinase GlpK [soil metagenome]
MRRAPLYLAIDQGGHASRALVFNGAGEELASSFAPLDTRRPDDGRVEQDPEQLLASVRAAAGDAIAAVGGAACIAAAGLATQRSSIVCWDRRTGEPLSPVISWQDRRNASWLRRQSLDPVRLREITGLVASPHYGASKLRWCLDHLQEVRSALEADVLAAGPVASYLLCRLLEECPLLVDPANASRTLLWDYRARDWSPPLLEQFGIPRRVLPDCVGNRYAFGTLESHGIPCEICTGDQSAVPFAFGAPDPTIAYANLGTGAFVQRLIRRPPDAPHGLLVSVGWQAGDETMYLLEGTVNGAGSALDVMQQDTIANFACVPGAQPPLFLNGIGGLGSPYWLPDFASRFVGNGDAAARLQAVVESVAFLLQENLAMMRDLAGPLAAVVVTGGLAARDGLCQAIADVSVLPVLRPGVREATARGLAWLVADRPAGWDVAMQRFGPEPDAPVRSRFVRWREAMAAAGAIPRRES